MTRPTHFPIVGIGASAGAVEALEGFSKYRIVEAACGFQMGMQASGLSGINHQRRAAACDEEVLDSGSRRRIERVRKD